ncbi:MAG: hypothetical protein CMM87_01200 [Rickettsiales bacterium]|nr:hypothetical protein [Rickettsiales bacterium]|tara:strand:- start:92773 stop:93279 length:507 start_codon:yes stop_codon:yes gene_type:complete
MTPKEKKFKRTCTFGLKAIKSPVQSSCVENFDHKQLQLYQLFTNWALIVGDAHANEIKPIKTTAVPNDTSIILHVQPTQEGAEFLLQYQQQPIIDAINNYFGESLVKSLRIVKAPLENTRNDINTALTTKKPQALPEALEKDVSQVRNPALQDKLKSLYSWLSEPRNQ